MREIYLDGFYDEDGYWWDFSCGNPPVLNLDRAWAVTVLRVTRPMLENFAPPRSRPIPDWLRYTPKPNKNKGKAGRGGWGKKKR